jgi:hypothetical protein
MKKWMRATAAGLVVVMGTSCTTTYDVNGTPRQAVDPAGAAIGAVALGALAYSIGRNRGQRIERRRDHFNHYPVNHGWGGWGHGRHCR